MLRQLIRAYRNEKRLLAIIAVLSTLSAGTEALALISIAPLVQAAAQGETQYQVTVGPWSLDLSISQLAWFAGAMLITALIVQTVSTYVSARLTTGYHLRTRLQVVRAFQGADWGVQAQEREGWLRTLSSDNVDAATAGLQAIVTWLKGAVGTLVFLIGAMVVNFIAVFLIVIVLGLVTLGLQPLKRYLQRISGEFAILNVEGSQELATLTMNARELRVYGVVPEASARYRENVRQQREIALRAVAAENLGSPIFRTSAALLIVAMIAIAATRGSSGVAAVGIVAVLLYRSSNYATVLVGVQQQLARIVPTMRQLEEGLDKLWSHQVVPGHLEPAGFEAVEAESVTFRYPSQTTPAVADVSLRVTSDEVVGIVGPSGGGKTTLAELLIGLRRPSDGAVKADGNLLSDLSDQARAGCISLVSQNVPIMPGTVSDNIRFFRDIDDGDIEKAIVAAGLAAMIAEMPDGIDTVIGPGGRALSGGQAQRLGIARALAGHPSIIVLDEPTSALDAVAEQVVTETIGRLRGLVGVVVIAHRLTTLRHCDRIVVIENGRLADEGTMTEVRERNSFLGHAFEVGRLE